MWTHRTLFLGLTALAVWLPAAWAQPQPSGIYPLDQLKSGQHGEVWTVFKGTVPESFSVEVTGVVRNALGPGKSLILCQMTDPRVSGMGAVAGMSGSPLYIDGKFAGALSYQWSNPLRATHFAAFTPAADMQEVGKRVDAEAPQASVTQTVAEASTFTAMKPVFTMSVP